MAADSTTAVYGSDNFFSGGEAKSVDKPGGWGREPELAVIEGSDDRTLMATYREGEFVYHLPADNGIYRVRFRFMEPSAGVGERVFDVLANDKSLLKDFDIALEAGGILTVVEREFTVTVSDGLLELSFKTVNENAIVSAIEVMPTS